ncbi:MAG: DUF3592 domain-containing protein [Eubacterium sp.]|nr:DUF3592 domain-containing protein [Eubacterium sp.]
MKAFKIYLICCFLVTAVILGGLAWKTVEYVRGEKTEATVVGYANLRTGKRGKRGSNHNVTKVNLKYTVDGTEYVTEVKFDGKWKYEKGDKITVSFAADNPEKIHIIGEMATQYKWTFFWTAFMIFQTVVYICCKKSGNTASNQVGTVKESV